MGLLGWAKRKAAGTAVTKAAGCIDTPEEARAVADRIVEGEMSDATKAWLHSLVAAGLGAALSAAAQFVVNPVVLFSHDGWKVIVAGALAAALSTVGGLLKQSPLPPKEK